LERFENGRIAGAWSAERTKCYFYNSMQDAALSWYRMLKVVKIDTDDYEAVRTAFIQNFGDQTNNLVVITDFSHMKQRKDKTVQKFFTRIGEIAYNYDVKKPHDEIMGQLFAIPEEHAEQLEAYAAFPLATRRLIQQLNYQETQKNDISYLGLQFFIAGLRQDISMEVVKSGTTDMYQAFLTALAYETALRDKQERNGSQEPIKINEMEVDFEEMNMNAEIEAIKHKYEQKKMFSANNGSAYQQRSNGNNGNNYSNNGNNDNRNGGNQQSGSGSCKPNPAFGKTCHYCKKKNHFQSECYKRKRNNAPPVKVQEMKEQEGGKNIETIFN